jgi:hypothetical protein
MGRNNYRLLISMLFLAISGFGYSQQLNLFEEIETNNSSPSSYRNRADDGPRGGSISPEFTLIGTSHIGSEYSVIIQHRGGDTLIVKADSNSSTQIPGYSGYLILEVGSGSISIRYPEHVSCVEFRDQGVSCAGGGNIAALSLTNGEPLSGNAAEASQLTARSSETAVNDPLINPFEALRAQQNNEAVSTRDGDNERFTPRRILPEDVPSGMRVVSTPFGDRLVEQ